ncbi:hypothetical protein TNCV_3417731 [Trichonephila clavipes]|nr:hypothetical protein TNCV_3417731 [Trichonephila clavipes]
MALSVYVVDRYSDGVDVFLVGEAVLTTCLKADADKDHLVILLKMDKWLKRRKFNDDNSDNDNAQVASYEIAELIAVNLKPHNLAEEIILPACRKIVKTMIGGSADIDICKIPLSNDTIHRRIKDMSENIEQNTEKLLQIRILLYKSTEQQILQEMLN